MRIAAKSDRGQLHKSWPHCATWSSVSYEWKRNPTSPPPSVAAPPSSPIPSPWSMLLSNNRKTLGFAEEISLLRFWGRRWLGSWAEPWAEVVPRGACIGALSMDVVPYRDRGCYVARLLSTRSLNVNTPYAGVCWQLGKARKIGALSWLRKSLRRVYIQMCAGG